MTVKTGDAEPTDLKSNMTMIAGPGENEMKTIIYANNLRSVLGAFIRGRIPRRRTHFRIAILSFLLFLSFLADPTPVLALDQTGAGIHLPVITIPSSKVSSSTIDVLSFMHA
jgi:Mn2+/Fe2+ NRAMP family transporter